MGVHFKPGGAYPFLGMPAHELADTHVYLCDLWGPGANVLRERLCELPTPGARFSLLETALRRRLAHLPERRSAVAHSPAMRSGVPMRKRLA